MMETKRIAESTFIPVETTVPESQPLPKISRGVGETSDSFQISTRQDQFSLQENRSQQTVAQNTGTTGLLLEFQKRQFASGTFNQAQISRASQTLPGVQLSELERMITDYVIGGDDSGIAEITKSLQAAAAALAGTPYVGQIIAAVLAAIAAVIMLIGQMQANAKEQEAASKEKETHHTEGGNQKADTLKEEDPMERLKKLLALLQTSLKPSDLK